MNKKITAILLIVCMLTSILTVFTASAAESDFYKLYANDVLDRSSYGYSADAPYNTITNAASFGTGWNGAWSKSATSAVVDSAMKLDGNGMFTGRPSATANVRIYRKLAQTIDFSKEGTYTFTATLKEQDSNQTDYYFVCQLGDSGIEFGVDSPTAKSYTYPFITLPGGAAQEYNGTTYDSMIQKETKEFYVVLEITAKADGADTLKVKGYRNGSEDVGFLKTVTAEISDKTVTYLGAGFDYCEDYTKKNGVTRLNGIKAEYDNPALMAKIEAAANSAQATQQDIKDGFSAFTDYAGSDRDDLIAAIKANASTLGYPASAFAAEIVNMTPDITAGQVLAHEFADSFDIEYSYPLSGSGTLYIRKSLDNTVVASSTAISGSKVTMEKTGTFEAGTEYVLTTDDATDFKGDLLPETEFATVVVPTVNVQEGARYDYEKTITWDDEAMEVSAKLLYPGEATYTNIQNNTRVTEAGDYKLIITASLGSLSSDTAFSFTIMPDIKPVAADVTISLAEGVSAVETGAVLKGTFVYSDENDGDSLKEAYYVWYRTNGSTRTKIGEGAEYTLTEADEEHDIILEVTPVSDSSVNPVGDPAESQPFKGAYAPVGENLVIDASKIAVGSKIKPEFDYSDANGDAQGEHIIKWYKYGERENPEITEKVDADGSLEITADLIGEYVYAVVTPVSVCKPYYGAPLTSADVEIAIADAASGEGGSDFATFSAQLLGDRVGDYGLTVNQSTNQATIPSAAYADNSTGFAHNWSLSNGSYVSPASSATWFQRVAGSWGLSWRGPNSLYRAVLQPIDMSQNGTYTFITEVLEYAHNNAASNLTGSDFRMYIGGTDWYYGYTDASTTSVAPQIKAKGNDTVSKGADVAIATASGTVLVIRADVVVTDGEDTFRVKMWDKSAAEPEEWSATATGELGNYTAGYVAFTPNPNTNNGMRYMAFSASYENAALIEKINSVIESANPTEEQLREAFAAMSTYPEGSEKDEMLASLKEKAAGMGAATAIITEASVSASEAVVAHELKTIELKYDYMLDPGSEFVLKDEGGSTIPTTAVINENKVKLTITGSLESGTEYTLDTTGAADYKGDAVPGITFTTYATPEINVSDGETYSEQYQIIWEDTPAATVTLTTPSNVTSTIQSGYVLSELGEYKLVLAATDTRTISFEVVGDVAPTAESITIRGLHETGATLTGSYKYVDKNGDAESGTTTQWYRVSGGNRAAIGTPNSATYTLTAADENCNIVFGVTAKSATGTDRTGEEVFSGEFTGAYAPVAKNVEIAGENKLGGELSVAYDYYDENNDAEGNTVIKWYLENGTEITENVSGGKLLITESVFEKKVYARVTPVSTRNPATGIAVEAPKLLMPSKPVVTNVVITGTAVTGNMLTASYDFSDPNFDQQGETKFEWKNALTGTFLGRGRTLEVTPNLAGVSITVTVTGVSEKAPYESEPVTSAAVTLPTYLGGGTGGGTGGGGGGNFAVAGSMSGSGGGSGGGTAAPVTPAVKTVFGDVYGHWAQEYVTVLLEKGIVMEAEKFRPEDSISRAELLAMLFRSAGTPLSEYAGSYSDVNAGDWYAGYVQTALDMGIIAADESFRPNDAVTREEAAKIVANMLKLTATADAQFNDKAEISDWAVGFVNAVYEAGIFKGDDNGNFKPKGFLKRAEMATVIYRLLEAGSFNAGGAI